MKSDLDGLLGLQNADGGWSYRRGSSWAEPTCYAVLALAASGMGSSPEVRRGAQWLRHCQRPDGGIAPRESVEESTWLTALPLLWPAALAEEIIDRKRASQWILLQSGRESGWAYRLRVWMMGAKTDRGLFEGWPWYPGTAAWTIPTALSLLALAKLQREGHPQPGMDERLAEGRAFLLDRRCRDGGWNHGSTKALGYDSDSYPETTGLALLALHGVQNAVVSAGLARGEQQLSVCRSSEAANWLCLGLMAHGRHPSPPALTLRGGTMGMAMQALADSARDGRNLFLET